MKRTATWAAPAMILLVLVGLIWGATKVFTPTNAHASHDHLIGGDTTGKHAQILVEKDIHDFGNIEQNTFVDHTFFIKNVGTDTLTIISTSASCGCTAAVMDNMKVAPNGISRLKVKYDAHNKGEGAIVKTITVVSNSRTEQNKVLRIKGTVVKSVTVHKKGEMDKGKDAMMHLAGIFEGDCAKCHVDKGRGELGARLFDADCAICHGDAKDGKPGPALGSDALMRHDKKSWTKIISDGIKNSHMPAFDLKHKGPLNKEEIASIVEYLDAYKKEMARTKSKVGVEPVGDAKIHTSVKKN